MTAQEFNQRYAVGAVFGLRMTSGLKPVRTMSRAHDTGHGNAMIEINRNPWFVPVRALAEVNNH